MGISYIALVVMRVLLLVLLLQFTAGQTVDVGSSSQQLTMFGGAVQFISTQLKTFAAHSTSTARSSTVIRARRLRKSSSGESSDSSSVSATTTSTVSNTKSNQESQMSKVSASAWVGLQALTAFCVIAAAIACALLMRPLVQQNLAARQYAPI